MIFVTLGTQDKSFKRLLVAIQEQIDKGNLTDQVIVEAGCTKLKSNDMEIYDLMESEKFEQYMKDCDLLITHGGVGSILTALENGKAIIAVPRLKKYREAANDHQKQIIEQFAHDGYLLPLYDLNEFDTVLQKRKRFKPRRYISRSEEFIRSLEEYIETGRIKEKNCD